MLDRARPGRLAILLITLVAVAVIVVGLGGALGNGPSATATPAPAAAASPVLTASPAAAASPLPTASPVLAPGSTAGVLPAGPGGSAPAAIGSDGSGSPASPGTSGEPGSRSLADLLVLLSVATEHRSGYVRELFPHWIDADGNGCDTRREVLIKEAIVEPLVGSGCSISGGRWLSQYDGIEVSDATKLDIDHLVPLAEAWDSGAGAWTTERRTRYANDLGVDWALIAVTASSNRSKGDQDPAEWLPPLAGEQCDYLAMWLAVKIRWSLTIDPTEQSAIRSGIGGCPQRMPVLPAP